MPPKALKFNPIIMKEEHVTSFRKKLVELVARMKRDYENELMPLIKKMNERQRRQVREHKELFKAPDIVVSAAQDAVKYFTAYEVARMLSTLKSRVINDIRHGRVKGAIHDGDEWLIPEDMVPTYAKAIGKEMPETDPLMKLFNDRMERLRRKYQDLLYAYQSMAEAEAEKTFKQAKKDFKKQFEKTVGINILEIMAEKGLKQAYEAQVSANVNLIKSLPEKYFTDIQQMTIQSVTGQKKFEGGLFQAIQDLTGATNVKAKLIARDQTSKAVATFSHLRMQNIGVIGYEWNNAGDRRVAGNPSGLYPNADDKSKYHGNHWDREGKFYLFHPMKNPPIAPDGKPFRQPPADSSPGMSVNCRCFADPVIPQLKDWKNLEEMKIKKEKK